MQEMGLSRNALNFNLSIVELSEQLISLDVSYKAIYGSILVRVVNLTTDVVPNEAEREMDLSFPIIDFSD